MKLIHLPKCHNGSCFERGSLLDLVDPRMGSGYNKEEVMAMINVALLCTNVNAIARPVMSSVVSMLEGKVAFKN